MQTGTGGKADPTRKLAWLNALPSDEATRELLKCCGSTRWAKGVEEGRPYDTVEDVIRRAHDVWWELDRTDWLEAFRSHPKIGEQKASASVSAQSQQWSSQEQKGVQQAPPEVTDELARLNREYEEKFGFIFIVCATGKSSDEILALLRQRLANEPDEELATAATEQVKITELRLQKLLSNS